ncbi:low affinity immunoglobulin gamma Fc region receptor II-like isoform X2 [Anguilla anguilla]|uniref:low affinity immunoglobulin gamma Fc region receptor II-like isoform X2 n=1 Tax=Anguilla anguilla TaxID=7936 RepID=UPI0015B35C68|nr:low affinity immunoglobulin gamma Fc region receptor II-like isoform X2 [Anguilla anguilla]
MQANRGVTLILLSLMARLGSPKAVLTLQPNWPLFFTGETVGFRCLGQPFKHYGFIWYRNESNRSVVQHTSYENTYIISPVTEAHSGIYRCADFGSYSDHVGLNVSALPKAKLTAEPKWRPLYNGETVTLRCEVDSYSNWTYSWYKDQTQMAVSQTAGHSVTGNRLTIPGAAGSDQGQYWCEGRLEGRKVTSQHSDSINLTVAALPKATLIVKSKWRPLYNGETVTLRCEVDSYSNWTHFWYRDDHNQTATSLTKEYSVNITGAAGSHQGQYWCEGRLEGRKVTSQRSDSITLTVAGRLVFGLGAAPLLLASIILCVKWCRRPGSPNEAAVKYTEENVEVDL